MALSRIHHVAYRCNDAKETVEFYQKNLNMDFQLAIAEDQVPSTKAPDPYMHVFLDAGNGNVLAFFELPNSPRMGRDLNTPEWVQHIAFEVTSMDELLAAKANTAHSTIANVAWISKIEKLGALSSNTTSPPTVCCITKPPT